MKNNSLDDIIKCDIDIARPASSDATFDTILLVVTAPTKVTGSSTEIKGAFAISKADDLLDYGYDVESAAYKAATVAFSQSPAPSELIIYVRAKTEGETYEDIATALATANSQKPFYGVHLTSFREASDIAAMVSWVEANEKLACFEYTDIENMPVKNTNFNRTYGMFSGLADGFDKDKQPAENEYAALGLMAKCFGYEPGSETWDTKELSVVVPSALNADQKKTLAASNINCLLRYGGCNVNKGGAVLSGEWIDVIRFRDWLKNRIQLNVFNAIKLNTKVPFTDGGIGMIESAMDEALSKGQKVGGISETSFDGDGNEIPGYTITVPLAADLTESERASRKLTGVKWSARLSGAIHIVEIHGNLTF